MSHVDKIWFTRPVWERRKAVNTLSCGLILNWLLSVCCARAQAQDYHSETVISPTRYTVESSAAASHLDTEDSRIGNVDTAQILTREPDLHVRRTGGLNGPAYLTIRGADANATHYSLDGVPIHSASTDAFDINALMGEMVGRIDVYRTTLPIALGAPSPGGVVDFRLRDSSKKEAWAVASWGSWMTRKLSAATTMPHDNGYTRIAASYRGSRGNYLFYDTNGTDRNLLDDTPNQIRENNDFNQGSILLIHEQKVDNWRLRFSSLTGVYEGGVPGIDIAQSKTARRSRIQEWMALHAKTRAGKEERTDVSLVASLSASRLRYHDLLGEIGYGRQERSDGQVGGYLAVRTSTWLPHQLSVHAVVDTQLEAYHPNDRVSPVIIASAGRVTPSVGVEGRWESKNDRFSVSAGTRYHHYIQYNDSREGPGAPEPHTATPALSPQIGMTAKVVQSNKTTLTLFGYLSRTHRQPGFAELFGDNGTSIGNADLKMEKQSGAEAGAQLTWDLGVGELGLRGAAWKHWRQDAIEYVVLATGVRKPFNVDGAEVVGQELALSWTSLFLAGSWSVAHLDSVNLSENPQEFGKKLPLRSPWSSTLQLRIQPIPWKSLDAFGVESTLRYDGPFYADLRNNREYPDRLEWDVALRWKWPFEHGPTMRIEALNILNRRMTTIPGRDGGLDVLIRKPISDYAGYPRPGRSLYVSLSWALP